MAKRYGNIQEPIPESRPAESPEDREKQLIALATNLAEKQLRDGSASPMIIAHYLKLGTARAELEVEQMKVDNELKRAKTEAIKSGERLEELFRDAMSAFKSYVPSGDEDDNDN